MSVLGNAIRSNADLHRALYRIVSELAVAHALYQRDVTRPQLDRLCELAAAALPHLPAPPTGTEGEPTLSSACDTSDQGL